MGPFGGPKRGSGKHNCEEGSVPHEVSQDFQEGNGFHGTQETFGFTIFPSTTPRQQLYRDFLQIQKSPGALSGPLGGVPTALCRDCQDI